MAYRVQVPARRCLADYRHIVRIRRGLYRCAKCPNRLMLDLADKSAGDLICATGPVGGLDESPSAELKVQDGSTGDSHHGGRVHFFGV